MKKTKLAAALLLTGVLFTGCGSSKSEYYDAGAGYYATEATTEEAVIYEEEAAAEEYTEEYTEDAAMETAEGATEAGTETLDENTQAQERKLIKTVDLYVETENYDTLLTNLEKQVEELGGYIEYQYQYNGSSYSRYEEIRNAQMSIRIPVNRLDEFIGKVEEQSNVTNKEERVEDVTLQYVDLESRKTALITEQERLLELLEKAESVEDIISIEQRLSEVRYELESMESQLRTLDNKIDYSTINLSIQEVQRITTTTEPTLLGRMKNGIMNSFYDIGTEIEDGFVWFVINIPYFLIWIVVIVVIIVVLRVILKRRKKKCAAQKEKDKVLALEAEKAEKEIKEKMQEEDKK
ncbi:MAG: DUF4349 domain-containing protein [Lachnospiraceae bacterium]|nr:DUF4349 domain-containing protein [Lachnospiraceae bacterium]